MMEMELKLEWKAVCGGRSEFQGFVSDVQCSTEVDYQNIDISFGLKKFSLYSGPAVQFK